MDNRLRLVSNIEGIHCFGCLNRINTKLQSVGADKIDIDMTTKIMKVDFNGEEKDAEKFITAVEEIGYKAKKIVVFDPSEIGE